MVDGLGQDMVSIVYQPTRVVEPSSFIVSQVLFIFFIVGEVGEKKRLACYEEVEPPSNSKFLVFDLSNFTDFHVH